MPYDERLAQRVSRLFAKTPSVTERKMFGGLAYLVEGNMVVVVSGKGGLLVRTNPGLATELVMMDAAQFAEMRGRQMRNWLRVDPENVRTSRQLSRWVDLGIEFASQLARGD